MMMMMSWSVHKYIDGGILKTMTMKVSCLDKVTWYALIKIRQEYPGDFWYHPKEIVNILSWNNV